VQASARTLPTRSSDPSTSRKWLRSLARADDLGHFRQAVGSVDDTSGELAFSCPSEFILREEVYVDDLQNREGVRRASLGGGGVGIIGHLIGRAGPQSNT
jgi:hypothetical protein